MRKTNIKIHGIPVSEEENVAINVLKIFNLKYLNV